jgi:ribosomal protein S6
MDTEVIETGDKRPVYEVSFHLVPTLSADEMLAKFSSLKDMLAGAGAQFISEEIPKEFVLAYEFSHTVDNKKEWFTRSYFGWVKFECDESEISKIDAALKLDRGVIRYLLVKTVRESTLYGKRFGVPARRRPESKHETVEEKKPIDAVELDKELDAMLSDEPVVATETEAKDKVETEA